MGSQRPVWALAALLLGFCLLADGTQARPLGSALDAPDSAAAAANPGTTLPSSALEGVEAEAEDATPAGMQRVEMKIINGDVVQSGEFDFMAALFNGGRFFCGAALLDNTTVLTASHCVVDTGIVRDPSVLSVWVMGTQYPVAKIFTHPGYSPSRIPDDNLDLTFDGPLHDIAVIKLASAVPGSPVTVPLVRPGDQLSERQRLQVAGWGTTETGTASNVLKFGEVEYLPAYRCPKDYSDVLCGGGTGQNTCNGDSGGPILVRDPSTRAATVVGVTSHGPDCLQGPSYNWGFYTDVRLYADAIEAWRQGKEYEWDGAMPQLPGTDAASPAPDGTSGAVSGGGPVTDSPPVVWQPVPGWQDQWGPTWGVVNADSSSSYSWQAVFCSVFGC